MGSNIHCSYGEYRVVYDTEAGTISVSVGKNSVLRDGKLSFKQKDTVVGLDKYSVTKSARNYWNTYYGVTLQLTAENTGDQITVEFRVSHTGVQILFPNSKDCTWYLVGKLFWGDNMEQDTFAMSDGEVQNVLRTALGPAASTRDTMLYNRKKDEAFCLAGETVRLAYDWDNACYQCKLSGQQFGFSAMENVLAERYNIPFSPINKNSTFRKPPAGWMTWYAVKFDASEESVLRNVRFQEQYLKKYGADAIWVDWEWYHQDLSGQREDGVDTFHPDPKKYPNGMKYVSDEIKKSGFVPALWVGFTNEPAETAFLKEHPDALLIKKKSWCGTYFYDFSHPDYLNEYLPKAMAQVADWGYDAVKFDTLPIAIYMHEEFHENMYDPSLTTKEAFRNVVKKTREIIGENTYMMSCASADDPHFLWAADLFDGGRVGGDIFAWKDFLWEGVGKTLRYYPLHNVVLYADPDNVVLRDEFNTEEQALSRIAFVALAGLPMTFGDDFRVLQQKRVELIQKCLPVMDIHPMDLQRILLPEGTQEERETGHMKGEFPEKKLLINLAVERPFERYNVVDVFNTGDVPMYVELSVEKDLDLEVGSYLVFDYMRQSFLGTVSDTLSLELQPCESRILCFRKKLDRPQLLSTSRHISQGAVELREVQWEESTRTLHICSDLLAGEPYRIYVYVPDGYETNACEKLQENVWCLEFTAEKDGEHRFAISF